MDELNPEHDGAFPDKVVTDNLADVVREQYHDTKGIVTVPMLFCRVKLRGEKMKKSILRSGALFLAGAVAMGAVYTVIPHKQAQAPVANSNDKFSMVTVPILETFNQEAVFVLNNLTGVLVGSVINEQTGKFTHRYLRNVAADFNTGNTPEPKYSIVTGPVNLRGSGGVQPAYGVIYVAELSSGAVIAYAFNRPTNRNAGATMEIAKLDFFQFADSVGK